MSTEENQSQIKSNQIVPKATNVLACDIPKDLGKIPLSEMLRGSVIHAHFDTTEDLVAVTPTEQSENLR